MPAVRTKPRTPPPQSPVGTVRLRDAGNGQLVRMVKIRLDGKSGLRWLPFAKWWWERNRGPVPTGRRICHADGDLLNDEPSNLVALTPGEVFKLYHRLDPEMSRRNRLACGRSAARRNHETARARRESVWLPGRWYAVDFAARRIHNQPRRMRWMVYHDHGLAGAIGRAFGERVAAAKAGDVEAAEFVLRQAKTIRTWWRWVRPASLGWPGVGVMTALVLAALADASHRSMETSELLAAVTEMRRSFGWKPYAMLRPQLSHCMYEAGPWIQSRRRGKRQNLWWIADAGLEARVDGPRIVAVRGRDLGHPRFASFAKLPQPQPPAAEPAGATSCQP